ncbi:MAG: 3D domain-containing protein [bacterium]
MEKNNLKLYMLFMVFLFIGIHLALYNESEGEVVINYNTNPVERSIEKRDIDYILLEKEDEIEVKVTAYDLSVQSCGKYDSHPAYGITANGTDLVGKNWEEARTIAVDPNIIPLGSEVYVDFNKDKYKKYNGIYIANDTGGAIKGKHIDFFLGDFNSHKAASEAMSFGVTQAKIFVLKGNMSKKEI